MSLRARLTLVAASVVAVVVAIAAVTTYFVMRQELQAQIDGSLSSEAFTIADNSGRLVGPDVYGGNAVQILDSKGFVIGGSVTDLPVDEEVRAVAAGRRAAFYRDLTFTGQLGLGNTVRLQLREFVAPIPGRQAVLVVRNLDETHGALNRLRLILFLVALGGISVAAGAGRIVSNAALAPVRRLTEAAERIAETGEPSERVPERGRGELARLGASFNTMLGSLEE